MHPIERLRYVARSGWAGAAALGAEAAYALADLAEYDAAAILPACRRLLERNPSVGPLWWVAARMLVAGDPVEEAEWCARALDDDPTDDILHGLCGDLRVVRHGGIAEVAAADIVLVGTDAIGPGGFVIDGDDCGLLEAARSVEARVWVAAGVGRALPARLWQALLARLQAGVPTGGKTSFFDAPARAVPAFAELSGIDGVVGPWGLRPPADLAAVAECPEPPELLSAW